MSVFGLQLQHYPFCHRCRNSTLPFPQGELADYIDAQVRESQTKKTFDSLKYKVHGLAVSFVSELSVVSFHCMSSHELT